MSVAGFFDRQGPRSAKDIQGIRKKPETKLCVVYFDNYGPLSFVSANQLQTCGSSVMAMKIFSSKYPVKLRSVGCSLLRSPAGGPKMNFNYVFPLRVK